MVLPNKVNAVLVSSTDNPVTVTPLVIVNNASNTEIPLVVAAGSIRKKVPQSISMIKLKTKMTAECKPELLTELILCEILRKAINMEKKITFPLESMGKKF